MVQTSTTATSTTNNGTSTAGRSKPRARKEKRPIIYPHPYVVIHDSDHPLCNTSELYQESLSVEMCQELIGWEETEERELSLFKDRNGKLIHCKNNLNNRPFYKENCEEVIRAHLRGPKQPGGFHFNGEPIIIGKTGRVLNGQHSLASVPLAEQDRTSSDTTIKARWRETWKKPVTMAKAIMYGVDEDDDVVNSMDTCKPRSLGDVIYRSNYFLKMAPPRRKVATRMLDNAVRMMWKRSRRADAFFPKKNPAESLSYLSNHETLVKAVKHIMEENVKEKVTTTPPGGGGGAGEKSIGRIERYIGPGYASAMLYLMAASDTDPAAYKSDPCETSVNLDQWDKACEFWTLLHTTEDFKPVRYALGNLMNENGDGGLPTLQEKVTVLVNAWDRFKIDKPFNEAALAPEYVVDENGIRSLVNVPIMGGIDFGEEVEAPIASEPGAEPGAEQEGDTESGEASDAPAPTEEEIERQTEEARAAREEQKQKKRQEKRDAILAKRQEQRASKEVVED